MTFSTFERAIDRITPTFLMALALVATIGSVGLGF